MRIEVYRAKNWDDVPSGAYVTFDGIDMRYCAAFKNYPGSVKYVVIAWGSTGDAVGEPLAVLIATMDNIITGYVDSNFEAEIALDVLDEGEAPTEHDEPPPEKRRAALLARLRQISKAKWLLIHDADEIEGWTELQFREIDPPDHIPADEAVTVLAWGELPEDASTLLRARGLSWYLDTHRVYDGA